MPPTPPDLDSFAEQLAEAFHETYERLAPAYGYRTREATARPWAELPANNKALMIATARELIEAGWLTPRRYIEIPRDG